MRGQEPYFDKKCRQQCLPRAEFWPHLAKHLAKWRTFSATTGRVWKCYWRLAVKRPTVHGRTHEQTHQELPNSEMGKSLYGKGTDKLANHPKGGRLVSTDVLGTLRCTLSPHSMFRADPEA